MTILKLSFLCSCLMLNSVVQQSCSGPGDVVIATDDKVTTDDMIENVDLDGYALISSVEFSGDEGAYQFRVGISSQETGCDQYADWWEVLDGDGNLIYRRILAHSHVDEQPFVRSGGAVQISATDRVIVRAHMNNTGYGRQAYTGSVQEGFSEEILPEDFFLALDQVAPLPDGCAF